MAVIAPDYGTSSLPYYSQNFDNIQELLQRIYDNNSNIILAKDVRDPLWTLWNKILIVASQSLTASSLYSLGTPSTIPVGGISEGSTFSDATITELFDTLLLPYVAPVTNTYSVSVTEKQFGDSSPVSLSYNINVGSVPLQSVDFIGPNLPISSNAPTGSDPDIGSKGGIVPTYSTSISLLQYNTFTMSVVTTDSLSFTSSANFAYKHKRYYGSISIPGGFTYSSTASVAAVAAYLTDTVVKGLSYSELATDVNISQIVNFSNQYFVFASPAIFGFNYPMGFFVDNIFTQDFTRVRISSSLVNEYSYTAPYDVYVSNLPLFDTALISSIQFPTGVTASLYTAITGAQGSQGSQGSQGIQGPQGPIGLTGSTGATGSQGPQGFQGIQGATGSVGATGSQGPQGFQGDQGLIGPTGSIGATGSQGPQGFQGDQGLIGPQGFIGPTGSQGPQGFQGDQGSTGAQGSSGPTGSTGATGGQGPQGFQGDQGLIGPTGSIGATGSQGPQGFQGDQGLIGPTGSIGSTGSVGATGSQGPQGFQGTQGTQGVQGATGSIGATGGTGSTFKKTTEIEKYDDIGIYYVDGKTQEVILDLNDPIYGGLHGFRYVEKYNTVYATKRSSIDGDLTFFMWNNLNDLSSYTSSIATGAPSNYKGSDQIVYSPYKDALYAPLMDYDYNSGSTRIVLSEVDPITLVNSIVLNYDMTAGWWGAIGSPAVCDGNYLYLSFTNKAYSQTKLVRVDLDTFLTTDLNFTPPTPSAVPHAMGVDSEYLYFSSIWGTQNYIAKVNLSSFTLAATASVGASGFSFGTAFFSDDILLVGDSVYILEEGAYTNKTIIKIDKDNLSTQTRTNWLKTDSSHNLYAINSHKDMIFYSGFSNPSSATNSTLGSYNTITGDNILYNNPFSFGINEIYANDEMLYVAGFHQYPVGSTGSFIGKIHISELTIKEKKVSGPIINLDLTSLKIGGTATFTGTYSAGAQIVTVINGLITSVV